MVLGIIDYAFGSLDLEKTGCLRNAALVFLLHSGIRSDYLWLLSLFLFTAAQKGRISFYGLSL
jgi:hypothetical protein